MSLQQSFPDIVRSGVILGPHTLLKVGGPAEFLAEPSSVEELVAVMRAAAAAKLPVHVLGIGSNVLVPDEGIPGLVLRLTAPVFCRIDVDGRRVRAGGGAALADLISEAARRQLAGLETLIGIAATVGGALRVNAGDRSGEIGQFARRVEVLDDSHRAVWREHDELRFGVNESNLDDPVILGAEFELEFDKPEAIVKRILRAWIMRNASRPYTFEAAARLFRDPRGLLASTLIDQAGLGKTKVGKVSLSERNSNYVVAAPGAMARDVLRLIDLVKGKVRDACNVTLQQEITIW